MKKLILSLICACFLPSNMFAGKSSKDLLHKQQFQQEEQNFKKSQAITQDGVSFNQLEEDFREQYKHLYIPQIEIIDDLVAKYGWAQAGFVWKDKKLLVDAKTMYDLPASTWRWVMLHESGHAQLPYAVPAIVYGAYVPQALTAYFWGMHKKAPYKNIVTKIGSKSIATMAVGLFLRIAGMRAEERRADNFANKHADYESLKGGVNWCENFKKQHEKAWKLSEASQAMSLKTFSNLTDLLHPSIDSRITKIQKALKDRFGVKA